MKQAFYGIFRVHGTQNLLENALSVKISEIIDTFLSLPKFKMVDRIPKF